MTNSHLTQETLVQLAAGALQPHDVPHLSSCLHCQADLDDWQQLALVTRTSAEPTRPPSFDTLVAPLLPAPASAPRAKRPVPVRSRFTFGHAVGISALLVLAHLRMLLRLVVPLVGAGVALATAAAIRVPAAYAPAMYASLVGLVALVAALCVCVPAVESRSELFATTPVPLTAVLVARTLLVFALSLGTSCVGSLVVAARVDLSVGTVISAWLGPATLGGAVALLTSVWRSSATAAIVGCGLWLLGTVTVTTRGLPTTVPNLPTSDLFISLSHLMGQVWTTSPATLAVSAALLGTACVLAAPAQRHRLQSDWRLVEN